MPHYSRRAFLESSAILSAALLTKLPAFAEIAPTPLAGVTPQGVLAEKIALTAARLTTTGVPAYTDEMLLADVTLDSRRRFSNFSGDTSGRYLEALSLLPAPGRSRESLDELAVKIISSQRPDGRFGRANLAFTASDIGPEHMALLWGNGRLLVGLMSYYSVTKNPAALASARKLGDFLLAVRQVTNAPEVEKRLQGLGAVGYICFTQWTEGLSLLGHATSDPRYFRAAAEIFPLLPPRGIQHAHGYLTTLRGGLMLAEETHDAALQSRVESLWNDLTSSSDYIVDGGVLEYFGWKDPANALFLDKLKSASGEFPRNEGCGLADVIRLTLYRLTGNVLYLQQAERCYLNAFAHNQFATGDFGSRVWFNDGFMPTSSVDRAWWCCTMHGYRAFRDILDNAITSSNGALTVHLYEDLDWRRDAELRLRRTPTGATIEFLRDFHGPLRVRIPQWSSSTTATRNSQPIPFSNGPYAEIGRAFSSGERVALTFPYRTQIISAESRVHGPDSLGEKPLRAAIFCGPFLMSADEELDPMFFSEPWPGNVLHFPPSAAATLDPAGRLRLPVRYEHDGFPGVQQTSLRPIGEKPAFDQRTSAIWLNLQRA